MGDASVNPVDLNWELDLLVGRTGIDLEEAARIRDAVAGLMNAPTPKRMVEDGYDMIKAFVDPVLLDVYGVNSFWDLPSEARTYRSAVVKRLRQDVQENCECARAIRFSDGSGWHCPDCENGEAYW